MHRCDACGRESPQTAHLRTWTFCESCWRAIVAFTHQPLPTDGEIHGAVNTFKAVAEVNRCVPHFLENFYG